MGALYRHAESAASKAADLVEETEGGVDREACVSNMDAGELSEAVTASERALLMVCEVLLVLYTAM